MAKTATPPKPHTKTELLANIATATELPKEQVAAVLDALAAEIQKSLASKGAGVITLPGLVKIEKKQVPARKAEKGVPNPFKPGELMDSGKARLQQGQGTGVEDAQGDGKIAANAPVRSRGISISRAPHYHGRQHRSVHQ